MTTATASATFRIYSPDGTQMQQFSKAGDHQMLVQCFTRTTDGWEQTKGGWMWTGAARSRWVDLIHQGWTKAV